MRRLLAASCLAGLLVACGGGEARLAESFPHPVTCDRPRPPEVTPFPYNSDEERRSEIVDLDDPIGGTASFDQADVGTVAALLDERFLDPSDRQNDAPDAWAIFQFLCRHPSTTAAGYAVERDRPDYRVSLEAIAADDPDRGLVDEARRFCRDAEAYYEPSVSCFWD